MFQIREYGRQRWIQSLESFDEQEFHGGNSGCIDMQLRLLLSLQWLYQ